MMGDNRWSYVYVWMSLSAECNWQGAEVCQQIFRNIPTVKSSLVHILWTFFSHYAIQCNMFSNTF